MAAVNGTRHNASLGLVDPQRACPNADLIMADVFETLSRVSDSARYRHLS